MAEVGTLWVRLRADMADFEKNMKQVSSKLRNVGKEVTDAGKTMTKWVTGPIMAAGAGAVALASKIGTTADRLLDLNAITGMSTDAIQEWQHVTRIAGVSTEAVTMAVEGLVRRLPQLEAEGGRATEQLSKLGLSFGDLQAMAPDQMIDTLITRLANMEDPLERNAIGSGLFGGAWKDIAPILAMGADGIEAARKEAHELGLVMSRDALEGANDFRIEMEKLKAQFGAVFNEIGLKLAPVLRDELMPVIQEQVIPAIQRLAERIAHLIEWFTSLDPKWQKVILAAIGFMAALGPLLIVIGKIITVVGTITHLLSMLGPVFTALTGPIGLVIAVIAAAAAIGWYLYKNWDEVKEKIIELWEKVKEFFSGLWEGIKNIFSAAWEGIKQLFLRYNTAALIIRHWATISGFFKDLWDKVKAIFSSAWNGIVNVVKGPINTILGFVNAVISGFESMINAVSKAINSIPRFSIPSWVPGIGGKTFGLPQMPKAKLPRVPLLAEGGIITRPTLAVVGEAGPEAVVPLGRSGFASDLAGAVYKAVRDALKETRTEADDRPVQITLQIDRTVFARATAKSLRELQRQAGGVMIPL